MALDHDELIQEIQEVLAKIINARQNLERGLYIRGDRILQSTYDRLCDMGNKIKSDKNKSG